MFQDEMETHRQPTRMLASVGRQPEVAAPGANEKRVVYGGIDYASGRIVHTLAAAKSGAHFLAFLATLAAAYKGRKVRLVCDKGRFHHAKAVAAWLAAHRRRVEVFRLPPYCPSLNVIERLWGHLTRPFIANVLFKDLKDLVAACKRGIRHVNGRRAKLAFVFNHDDPRATKVP